MRSPRMRSGARSSANAAKTIIVGVNRYVEEEGVEVPLQVIDDDAVRRQVERVRAHKSAQDWPAVERTLAQVAAAANSEETSCRR